MPVSKSTYHDAQDLPSSVVREDTIGSGKTLTSFKAATLLKENEHIHKCVFVVDRKVSPTGQLVGSKTFCKN